MQDKTADVIVVGAGPAGVSAAITVARGGKKVLLIERGDNAGDKNMFGGCIYENAVLQIFPHFKDTAPIERTVTQNKIFLLNEKSGSVFSYNYPVKEKINSYTVIRSKWDRWCVEQAQNEGVYYAPKTVVRNLIFDKGVVTGVETDKEKLYCDIVILADGVNSLLAKQAGLRRDFKDEDVTLNVKEVYRLGNDVIEDRFGLDKTSGSASRIFGGPLKNMFAMGFMYTNKNTLTLGVGIAQDELKKHKINPSELLEKLKTHPVVAPYIKGGTLIEYSAHLIPEGSLDFVPKVYDNRILVAGDAAGFVDNMHLEGTNLAMLSGKLAGETTLEAEEKFDFSASVMSEYFKKLEKSIIIKDLKTHNDTIRVLKKNIGTISELYPELAAEFFEILSVTDGTDKKKVYNNFVKKVISKGAVGKSLPLGLFALRKLF